MQDLIPEDMLFLGGDFNCTATEKFDRNHIKDTLLQKTLSNKLLKPMIYVIYGEVCIEIIDTTTGFIMQTVLSLWHGLIDFMVLSINAIFSCFVKLFQ